MRSKRVFCVLLFLFLARPINVEKGFVRKLYVVKAVSKRSVATTRILLQSFKSPRRANMETPTNEKRL